MPIYLANRTNNYGNNINQCLLVVSDDTSTLTTDRYEYAILNNTMTVSCRAYPDKLVIDMGVVREKTNIEQITDANIVAVSFLETYSNDQILLVFPQDKQQ